MLFLFCQKVERAGGEEDTIYVGYLLFTGLLPYPAASKVQLGLGVIVKSGPSGEIVLLEATATHHRMAIENSTSIPLVDANSTGALTMPKSVDISPADNRLSKSPQSSTVSATSKSGHNVANYSGNKLDL